MAWKEEEQGPTRMHTTHNNSATPKTREDLNAEHQMRKKAAGHASERGLSLLVALIAVLFLVIGIYMCATGAELTIWLTLCCMGSGGVCAICIAIYVEHIEEVQYHKAHSSMMIMTTQQQQHPPHV